MRLLRNVDLTKPVSIVVAGYAPAHVPATDERTAGVVLISDAHYAAIVALASDDPRRVALATLEITDLGAEAPDGRLTAAQQLTVAAARISKYTAPMAQRVA